MYQGKAHKVGEHIDTDAIIPARFLVTTDPAVLGANCMEGLEPGWIKRVKKGRHHGRGRELRLRLLARARAGGPSWAPASRWSSPTASPASSTATSFNMGLVLLEIGDDVAKIGDGDELRVDADAGVIEDVTTGATITCKPVPPFMKGILDKGGLVPYVRDRLAARA